MISPHPDYQLSRCDWIPQLNYGGQDIRINGITVQDFAPDMDPNELLNEIEMDNRFSDEDFGGDEAGVVLPKIEGARGLPGFAGVDAAELSEYENEQVDWIVDFMFSFDQPTVFGAASKAGKTTQLIDLAVALATETKRNGWVSSLSRNVETSCSSRVTYNA